MNKTQRKELDRITALINNIDLDEVEQALCDIEAEERDKFDGMPEGLQATEKGQAIEAAADALAEALSAIEEAQYSLKEAIGQIESVQS